MVFTLNDNSSSTSTIVILSTADFDSEVWTNKQHLARGLLANHKVIYVESLGLRRPTFSKRDVVRMWRKLRRTKESSTTNGASKTERPEVLRPLVIPFHQFRLIRTINYLLINRLLIPRLPQPSKSTVFWTFSPLNYGLDSYYDKVVYHSVDLLHTIPGIPVKALLESEKALLQSADEVIASSRGVQQHLESLGRKKISLWENVASVELFSGVSLDRRARAIFAGNLTPTKVQAELLLELAERGVEVALAGPINIDGTSLSASLAALLRHSRVDYLGNLDLERLAVEFAKSQVGLIPYYVNDYTAGVFPMKVYEYLAAGLSVVSTPLRSLHNHDIEGLHVAQSADDFVGGVMGELEKFSEGEAHRRRLGASNHSWTRRTVQAEEVVAALTKSLPQNGRGL